MAIIQEVLEKPTVNGTISCSSHSNTPLHKYSSASDLGQTQLSLSDRSPYQILSPLPVSWNCGVKTNHEMCVEG